MGCALRWGCEHDHATEGRLEGVCVHGFGRSD